MKRTKVIAALSATATLVLAVPATASAQSPPPGAFVVQGMGGHVWGENALPGHEYRYPLTATVATASGTPVAGVKVTFFLGNGWDYFPASGGPQFVTSVGLSDTAVDVTNSKGVATSPPITARGPGGSTWFELCKATDVPSSVQIISPMWVLGVLAPFSAT